MTEEKLSREKVEGMLCDGIARETAKLEEMLPPYEKKPEAVEPQKTDAARIKELQERLDKLETKPPTPPAFLDYALKTMDVQKAGPACARTGFCCETVLLMQSPRELRDAYRDAMRDSTRPDAIPGRKRPIGTWEDIHLVYPMLAGKCRGKYKWPSGSVQFVYGPCKNLTTEKVKFMKDGLEHEKEIAACSIHDDRPRLCSGYPDYGHSAPIQMGSNVKPRNPGYMRGCGYNVDPNEGYPREQFEAPKLLPLEDNEK